MAKSHKAKHLNENWMVKRLLELPEEISKAEEDAAEERSKLNALENYHQKLTNEFNALIAITRFYDSSSST